jgi:hypothetical protein
MESQVLRRVASCCLLFGVALFVTCFQVAAQDANANQNDEPSTGVAGQQTGQTTKNESGGKSAAAAIPVVDAEMGPCSVEFTVTDPSYKAVRDAKVRVRISYGFMGVRRLDLEVSTNADGKARFVGLPNNLKRALYFYAEQGKLRGTAVNDAALKCNASHTLTMRETADESQPSDSGDKGTENPDDRRQP